MIGCIKNNQISYLEHIGSFYIAITTFLIIMGLFMDFVRYKDDHYKDDRFADRLIQNKKR